MEKNRLYYGDNLEVLRQHVKDESVDLIYLDPPFNSRQDYNVLFAEKDGTQTSLQACIALVTLSQAVECRLRTDWPASLDLNSELCGPAT